MHPDCQITIIIAGNPMGIVSAHHEKLVLVDPECTRHCYAFAGGFDVTRGRYDSCVHTTHKGSSDMEETINPFDRRRKTRVLWHDIQLLYKGPVTALFYLHFWQRWLFSMNPNPILTKNHLLPIPKNTKCLKHRKLPMQNAFSDVNISLQRIWKSISDS